MDDTRIMEKIEPMSEALFCASFSGPETIEYLQHWLMNACPWIHRRALSEVQILSQAASNVLETVLLAKWAYGSDSTEFGEDPVDSPPVGLLASGSFSRDEINELLLMEVTELAAGRRDAYGPAYEEEMLTTGGSVPPI